MDDASGCAHSHTYLDIHAATHTVGRRHRRVACAVTSHPFSPFSHCNRIVSIINEPRLGFSSLFLSLSLSLSHTYTRTHARIIYILVGAHTFLRTQQYCAGHAVVYPCCWLIHVWENHQRRNGRRKFPFAVTKERDTWAYIHCAYSVAQKS